MSLYSKKNTEVSIFQDVSVCVAGDLSAARALSNEVKRLGGTVHFSVSDKTTMLVLVKGPFSQKEYKTKLALRKNVPIVSERYVKDCAAQERRLDLKGYMLTEEERIPDHIMERCKQLEEQSVFVSLDSLNESGEVKEETTKSVNSTDEERNSVGSSEHNGERSDDVQDGVTRGAPKKRGTVAWRSAKIFISSTFKDMHGERDYITRFVLPELQERARALRVNVHMIDLRWGVTGEEQPLQTCLAAVDEARPFFVGLVGERYGWVPERYDVPPLPQYNWLRSYPLGHSITHLEMYYGAMRDPSSAEASFYIRDPSFIGSVPSSLEKDFVDTTDVARKGLAMLKEQIRASGIPLVDHYGCNWRGMVDGKPMVGGLEAFGEAVLDNLWTGIVNRFGGASVETDEHESFASAQSSGFVGRSRLLQDMNAYVGSDSTSPLLVNGEPGSGKSSLVAAFTAKMLKGNDAHTICHFVGAAPGSTDLRFMLVRLCTLLQPHYVEGLFPPRVPEGLQEVQQLFLSAMATPPKSKVVVVIDAVNQLDPTHNAHGVEWMPSELPSNGVRLVVSVLPGPVLTRLELKCWERLGVGPLEEEDRKEMVRTILQKHSKKLAEEPGNDQLGLLLRKKDAYKPLYLVIACEELRVFGVYEQLSMRIRQMAGTVQELLREVLERLEGDHGEELVRHALAMIACSRGGLKEDELRQVLVDNVLHMNEDEGTKAWQYLLRSLNVFLTRTGRHGDVCTFFHEQLLIAVRAVYLSSDLRASSDLSGRVTLRESDGGEAREMSSFECAVHKMMADYFHNVLFHLESEDAMLTMLRERAVNVGADLEKEIVTRAVAHVVYHGTLGGAWHSVYKYLTSLPFIECKCLIGLTYDLVSDYLRITRPGVVELFRAKYCFDREEANNAVESLEEFHSFVQFSAHTLQRRPDLAFSLARSAPSKSGPAQAAADRWHSLLERRTHLSWLNKPESARPCLLTMLGHDKIVRSCDTFPTSERDIIVSGGEDSCARVWDTRTGEQGAVLKGHSATVLAVAFAPCGNFVATGSWDRTLMLWDTKTWQQVDAFSHRAPITAVAFSGDSSEILIGDNNGGIRVLTRMGLRSIHSEAPHSNKVERVEYNPLSRDRCATAGGNVVKLWRASPHGMELERELSHRRSVRSLAYMPKGGLLAVASERKVLMWDLESLADTPTVTLTGHNDDIATIAWSRNGEYFISGSHDNMIFIWETTNWNRLGYFSGHTGTVLGVRFSHNPDRIVSCSYDRSVKLWDRRRVMRKTGAHTARILGVAFSHSGQRVVTGSRDKMVKVWDVATGNVIMTLAGHRSNVLDVDISQDGTMIASCSRDRTAIIWDAATGSILHTLEGHTELVAGCKFSPDGRILVTGSDDKTARVWDTSNGSCIGVLYGHRDAVTCVAVSYDGKRIATGSRDTTLKLWDARTRSKVATLSRHAGQVMCCAFSRDNERILTGGDDWKLVESSARNAKQLHVWTNHSAAVRGCSYSANGKLLVSVSTDGTAVVYRTDTKEEVCSYACQSRATAVSFSHIGSRLAVGDGSGQMYLLEPVHAASEALE